MIRAENPKNTCVVTESPLFMWSHEPRVQTSCMGLKNHDWIDTQECTSAANESDTTFA